MYRWKYHWVRSRSVGAGRATMRAIRGLRYWVMVLMVPPLPAASRPSKMTTSRTPLSFTHSCTLTNSACSRYTSAAYAFLPILLAVTGGALSAVMASA